MLDAKKYYPGFGSTIAISTDEIQDAAVTTAKMAAVASDVSAIAFTRNEVVTQSWTAAQAATSATDGVHSVAITGSDGIVTVTTGFTALPCARNLTATCTAGTAGHVKAVQIAVTGTDASGATLTESLPAFTVDTPGTVTGVKAFKTVTQIVIPAHDGDSVSTKLGFGEKLGLAKKATVDFLALQTSLNGVAEATPATFATSTSVLASNTVDLNSSLNGTPVRATFVI